MDEYTKQEKAEACLMHEVANESSRELQSLYQEDPLTKPSLFKDSYARTLLTIVC